MSRLLGFIGPSYTLSSINVDCQRCINLFPELNELGTGKEHEVASLLGTPGLRLLATIGNGPIRGNWFSSKGDLYIVSGPTLYKVASNWTYTTLGTLLTSTGRVSMSDNGLQLMIVDGPNGYVWDFTLLTFTQITAAAFPGADLVDFMDHYLIFNKPNSQQFGITGLDEVTFNALDFGSSSANPDNLISILCDHKDLWLFGTKTIEVFYDSGAANFPFEAIQGAFVEVGCAAKFSPAKMNNTVYWVGSDERGQGVVYQASGYQPTRISTHAVEAAIRSYGDISGATAWVYQEGGHSFYNLNFPNASTTWVFDTATKLWHERVYTSQGQFQRHRADNHSFAYKTHVVGDYQNGNLYELTRDVYTDNGAAISRQRVSPHLSIDNMMQFYPNFQLDMETGTGLDGTGQGTDPQAVLQFSNDGGHTWSNEVWASIGKIGMTKARALWRRLGSARDRVFRVTITDPIKIALIGAEFTPEEGVS